MNKENAKKRVKPNLRLFRTASSRAVKEAKNALGHLEGEGGKEIEIPIRSTFIRSADPEDQSRLAEVIGAGSRRDGAGKGGRNTAGKGGGEVRLKLLLSLIAKNNRGWEKKSKETGRIPNAKPSPVRGVAYADLFGLYRSRVKEGAEPIPKRYKDYQGAKRVAVALNWLEENNFVNIERSDEFRDRKIAYEEDKAAYDKAKADYKRKKRDAKDLPEPKKPRDSVRVKRVSLLREGADSLSKDPRYVRPQRRKETVAGKETEVVEPYANLPSGFWTKGWIVVLPGSAIAVLLCLLDFSKRVGRSDRLRVRGDDEESYSLSKATWYKGSAYLWIYEIIEIDEDVTPNFAEFKAPMVYEINSDRLDDDIGLRSEVAAHFSGNDPDSSGPVVYVKRGFHFELAPDDPDTEQE